MENEYVCTGFGHREVYLDIESKLDSAIDYVVGEGCKVFMTGDMGEFDKKFIKAVIHAKNKNPEIKLILVIPYYTKRINSHKEYYESTFDEVILPDVLSDVHYKSAIPMRNKWMVDRSDFVISYVCRDFGGAYKAFEYAKRQNKTIIKIDD